MLKRLRLRRCRLAALRVCTILVAIGISPPVVQAQGSLPPEARAQILIIDIDKAINRKDYAGALGKIREFDSVGVVRPSSLYITEAKLAGQARDYPRARAALEKYFKAANASDASYKEAVSIYSALGDIEAKANAAAEARDVAAWKSASEEDTCSGYTAYLKQSTKDTSRSSQAVAAIHDLKCQSRVAHSCEIETMDGKRFARNEALKIELREDYTAFWPQSKSLGLWRELGAMAQIVRQGEDVAYVIKLHATFSDGYLQLLSDPWKSLSSEATQVVLTGRCG